MFDMEQFCYDYLQDLSDSLEYGTEIKLCTPQTGEFNDMLFKAQVPWKFFLGREEKDWPPGLEVKIFRKTQLNLNISNVASLK